MKRCAGDRALRASSGLWQLPRYCVEWGDGFYGNRSVDDTYYLNMCYMDFFFLIFTNFTFVYLFDTLGLSCSMWDP